MLFVSSWDDGHPCDMRLADLLARHGLAGTFFVPGRNSEGRPVLSDAARREIAGDFEIGSHTLDHVYLPGLPIETVRYQIAAGKADLESQLGRRVAGFCYPGGRYDRAVMQEVDQAGFAYARTTEWFRRDLAWSRLELPTTSQFFPHGRAPLTRNLLRNGDFNQRLAGWSRAVAAPNWFSRLESMVSWCAETDGVFHLCGHSWEIDTLELWRELDGLLATIAALNPRTCTLAELAERSAQVAMPKALCHS